MRRILLPALAGLLSASAFLGCSGSDDGSDGSSPSTAAGEEPAKVSSPSAGATGPASAGDRKPDAPDNAISDRPGGPGDD